MIIQKVPHYVDSLLTQEKASSALQGGDVLVAWYTNQLNSQSVVHSHPYYELVLPVSGSSVRYSIGGSVYDLHLGELILFPGEMFHSGKFNITADTSERLVVQIAPDIWDRAWVQSGLTDRLWQGEPVILDADSVIRWDFRGLLERMAQTVYLDEPIRSAVQCCEVTELILLFCHVIHGRRAAALRHKPAGCQGGCLPAGELHRPPAECCAAGALHLHQPGASVPRVQGIHPRERPRLSDQPADAALPQRPCRRHECAGCLLRQRLYELQQLCKELPRSLRHHPDRIPRPAPHSGGKGISGSP